MAKRNYGKKSYHRNYRLRRVRLQSELAIGALASDDVISGAITAAGVSTMRFISIDVAWSIADLGASVDDTFQFGVAHSDYDAAEIEECLEAQAGIDIGNKLLQEQANRLVRVIGVMTGSGVVTSGYTFNDGKRVKTRLNWLIGIGDTLVVWVRNGSGVVYTTGALISLLGDLWVKDSV